MFHRESDTKHHVLDLKLKRAERSTKLDPTSLPATSILDLSDLQTLFFFLFFIRPRTK